jgi:hypothetical protein
MKYITLLLALTIILTSCEGDQGPPGFDGANGINGLDGAVAQSFEREVDFFAPDYAVRLAYPQTIINQTAASDMTLVYLLWDTVSDDNGGTIDIWRLVPQVRYTNFGEFQYNYEFTNVDVDIFLEAPDPLTLDQLPTADVSAQLFRVVIIPADVDFNAVDITDYNAVMNAAGLTTQDIIIE